MINWYNHDNVKVNCWSFNVTVSESVWMMIWKRYNEGIKFVMTKGNGRETVVGNKIVTAEKAASSGLHVVWDVLLARRVELNWCEETAAAGQMMGGCPDADPGGCIYLSPPRMLGGWRCTRYPHSTCGERTQACYYDMGNGKQTHIRLHKLNIITKAIIDQLLPVYDMQ